MNFYIFLRNIVDIPNTIINLFNLKRKRVKYNSNLKILGKLKLFGKGDIEIMDNVTIVSSSTWNPTAGGTYSALIVQPGGRIVIGSGTGISNASITAKEEVYIGKNVLIGSCCMISDNDFHPIYADDRQRNQLENVRHKKVKIEDNVFIGARSIILKGVTIGARSVVGAGSVVTKDIPEDEIWAGNPAKFIKKLK